MLAEISFDTELRIQEITILLLWIQELRSLVLPSGQSIDPSTKPNLFFTDKAIVIAQFQEVYFSPVSCCETRISPGLSEW